MTTTCTTNGVKKQEELYHNGINQDSITTESISHNNTDAAAVVMNRNTTMISDRNIGITQLNPTIVTDMIPYIILCIAILHGIYMYFYNIYAHHSTIFFGVLRIPSPEDCIATFTTTAITSTTVQEQQTIIETDSYNNNNNNINTINEKCGRPDLFAFQIVSGIVFIVVSSLGLYAWYHHQITQHGTSTTTTTNNTKRYLLTTPALRLYGYQYESHIILIINLSYQIWDFIISLFVIPEYCTTIMLLHHFVAAIVAYYGLYNYMFNYYAIFFLGLSEVSSIFLVSLDLHKYFIPPIVSVISSSSPSISNTSLSSLSSMLSNLFFVYTQHVAGPLFVITFIYYRIILWYSISQRLWNDVRSVTTTTTTGTASSTTINSTAVPTIAATKSTTDRPIITTTVTTTTSLAEQLRPHRTYILYIWLYANLPMGVLQLYFLSIILYEIQAKFF